MFLKYLIITNTDGLIRRIDFRLGMNLIVDNTTRNTSDTGNNVGKTTLLRLIDYCLGEEAKYIYTSSDRMQNQHVKEFLRETEVLVEMCLCDSLLDPKSRTVTIRRNFLRGKKCVREIDGKPIESNEFEHALQQAIWGIKTDKPSFREIISHSLRINDERLAQPLRTITQYQPDVVYETLHMFLFGANINDSERKVELSSAIKTERAYKNRLEKTANLSELLSESKSVKDQIELLEKQKAILKLNPDFANDLNHLAEIKHRLSVEGTQYNNLKIRRSLILEAAKEIKQFKSNANANQVAEIYRQACSLIDTIQHSFEDLLHFHNEMLARKEDFITEELPALENEIEQRNKAILSLQKEEKDLEDKLNLMVNFETFDDIIIQLNNCHQKLGMLEQSIKQIQEVNAEIANKEEQLTWIDQNLFSDKRQNIVQEQLDKFNIYFSKVSMRLYNESYAIGYKIITSKDGKSCYQFYPGASDNYSTGKKQGETTCFDIAYISFAEAEQIPCLHFVLNDKKELMDDNQLIQIADLAERQGNIQYVASILRDKLPEDLTADKYIVQKLSKQDRLFRIEDSSWHKSKQHPV